MAPREKKFGALLRQPGGFEGLYARGAHFDIGTIEIDRVQLAAQLDGAISLG